MPKNSPCCNGASPAGIFQGARRRENGVGACALLFFGRGRDEKSRNSLIRIYPHEPDVIWALSRSNHKTARVDPKATRRKKGIFKKHEQGSTALLETLRKSSKSETPNYPFPRQLSPLAPLIPSPNP